MKAAFLLTIFALNIVVGFACAIGMDMGFNAHHHDHDEAMEATEHVHTDGSKHLHHNQAIAKQHNEANNQDSNDDNCCKDKVTKLAQLDKSVPKAYSGIHPVFFTAFLASFYYVNILPQTNVAKDIKQFVRSYHPPIPDIRIAIQSFQI